MFSKFHRSVIKTALVISVLCSANTAMALTLQQAKQQGLIGEANTGYVASVQSAANSESKATGR